MYEFFREKKTQDDYFARIAFFVHACMYSNSKRTILTRLSSFVQKNMKMKNKIKRLEYDSLVKPILDFIIV